MLSLENKEWKDFFIGETFNVSNTKPYHKKDLKLATDANSAIPYITRTNNNNGVEEVVHKENVFKTNKKNTIAFGAENATFFFQPFEYITGNKIYTINHKKINKFNGLFLQQTLNTSIKDCGFSYGQGLTGTRAKRRNVLLPVNEKNEPDYEYMEEYTKSIIDKKVEIYKKYIQNVLAELEYKEIEPLENKEWKSFCISETFDVSNTKPYHKKDLKLATDANNAIPYITRTNNNNGVEEIIHKENAFKTNKKNTIAFGAENATFFLQPFEYITGNKVYTIGNDKLNKLNGLFIQQVLNTSIKGCGFCYGQGLTGTRAKRRNVLLPINGKNEPDYEYMEQYSKNLMHKKIKQYLNYKNKEA